MSPASTSPTHPHQPTEPLPDRLPNAQPEQLADLHEEIIDRFGLKLKLRQFSFSATSSVSPESLLAFIAHAAPKKKQPQPARPPKKPAPEPVRLIPDGRLILAVQAQADVFSSVAAVLEFFLSRAAG
ncbi:MAG: hypothetical protein ACTFAL_12070 [Candidatus Electronema sp. V4]|uniref:hypothetical protein n=1 Tax=Candidatus Electronema sp. V4 TaxID=3454756 RepID=UPI00405547B5